MNGLINSFHSEQTYEISNAYVGMNEKKSYKFFLKLESLFLNLQ